MPRPKVSTCGQCGNAVPKNASGLCRSCYMKQRHTHLRASRIPPNPSDLCECGCGETTPIATHTNNTAGHVFGEHIRFCRGHQRRKFPQTYAIEDRGYETPCWIWQGHKHVFGYGRINHREAHQVFYERHRGPIPDGLVIDHLCRQPACVNPEHLEVVTQATNRRRARTTKLTAEQVREIRALAGTMMQKDIAARFGVSKETVASVIHRRKWRDV